MTARAIPYPPPWQDMPTLCQHICASPNTVDKWVMDGILPQPRKRGGKMMWKWAEVDEYLTRGDGTSPEPEKPWHHLAQCGGLYLGDPDGRYFIDGLEVYPYGEKFGSASLLSDGTE